MGMTGAAGSAEPAPGADLPRPFGTFTLLRKIAAGTHGEVFAAVRPVEIERFCALKILPATPSRRPELLPAMREEATRVVRRLHGNLMAIYDLGIIDQQLFIVSELVEGLDVATLGRRLRDRGLAFPVDVAVFVAMEVAAGLGALRRWECRGDASLATGPTPELAPRSILLSTDGQVKVVHYGAALAALGAASASPAVSGGHPAPVDLFGPARDPALVGRLLAGLVGPSAPPLLTRLIERAVSPDPAQRLADADELRWALASLLRTLRGPKAATAQASAAELVRGAWDGAAPVDRAALGAIAKAVAPAHAAGPPTWKAMTLTRMETRASRPLAAVPAADIAVGEVIPGTRYRVLSTVGEGGMGTVYAAEHVDLEKKVALKLLRADVAANAETMQWFRQEARAASKVGSDYICDVTDFGELSDGRVFFVMEFLDGQSLGRVLRQSARVPPGRAVGILRQVCKALGAAHDKGIVHLDVKPDNVMLQVSGKREDAVKVVDFGIAGLVRAQQAELGGDAQNTIAGTPEYIAPERAAGRGYDARADIYSLGAMAYEMLSGSVPFQGKSPLATLQMQMKDPPRPLSDHTAARDVPEPLGALVLRMLDKDPHARPASMAEVEALLCEAQIAGNLTTPWDDLDLPAVAEEWREKLGRRMPSARRPRRALLAVAAAVALVSLGTAGYLGLIRAPQVVVKEVRVELTKTEEAPEVAAALLKAADAARHERYVLPPADSALHHIEEAEAQADRLKRTSPGAAMLRRVYASALAVIGNELLKAGLSELGIAKFKEALMFAPDDAELQEKAGLEAEERKAQPPRERKSVAGLAVAALAPAVASVGDEAKDVAARVFLAATRGRLSEARLNLAALNRLDLGGTHAAQLADALRGRANSGWAADKKDEARSLYALIYELDSSDTQARDRSREPAAPSPLAPPVAAAASPPALPAALVAPPAAARTRRKAVAPPAADAAEADTPRNPVAAQAAAELGQGAMARGRLNEAEAAFTRAVRADAQNAAAVTGLGEVAFERARYSDALDFARRAARLSPRNAKVYLLAGDAYFKLLRYDDALRTYDKARALSPQDDEVKSRIDRVRAKFGPR